MRKLRFAVVIPARYASVRFPGKPLVHLLGKTMLAHVCDRAREALVHLPEVALLVATDDERIAHEASACGVRAVMTPTTCPTGTDRVLCAVEQLPKEEQPDFVINLQGDAPCTPPHFITQLIQALSENPMMEIITPVVRLTWAGLDRLRTQKIHTPFSGTTVIVDKNQQARWFSKNIIPAIRCEAESRKKEAYAPVYRHIGLYGYRMDVLRQCVQYPIAQYEHCEQLEQLRALEHGHTIHTITVDYGNHPEWTGVDSPLDALHAEQVMKQHWS